jgi:hypothetical protein
MMAAATSDSLQLTQDRSLVGADILLIAAIILEFINCSLNVVDEVIDGFECCLDEELGDFPLVLFKLAVSANGGRQKDEDEAGEETKS